MGLFSRMFKEKSSRDEIEASPETKEYFRAQEEAREARRPSFGYRVGSAARGEVLRLKPKKAINIGSVKFRKQPSMKTLPVPVERKPVNLLSAYGRRYVL